MLERSFKNVSTRRRSRNSKNAVEMNFIFSHGDFALVANFIIDVFEHISMEINLVLVSFICLLFLTFDE